MFHKSKMIFTTVFITVVIGSVWQSHAGKIKFTNPNAKKRGVTPLKKDVPKDSFSSLLKKCAEILKISPKDFSVRCKAIEDKKSEIKYTSSISEDGTSIT